MKKIFLFIVFTISIKFYSQHYDLVKPTELMFLDLFIEKTKEVPFFENDQFINENLRIKSKIFNGQITEYDTKGNTISEIKKSKLYDTKIYYAYKNNILVEKKTIIEAHKENISLEQKEEKRRADKDLLQTGIAAITNYDNYNQELLETKDLNKKNQISSFSYKKYNIDKESKELISDNSYTVSYDKDKTSEIKSKDESEKYFYDKNQLIKKEYLKPAKNLYSQDAKVIYIYHYDNKRNLTAIWKDETRLRKGEIDAHSYYLVDSANYDNKNRIVWKGTPSGFTVYKYDNQNNITESSYTQNNKLDKSKKYQYNSKNQILKITETIFANNKTASSFKNYIYDKDLLKEIQYSSEDIPLARKIVYEYNDKNQLTKKSNLSPRYSGNQDKNELGVDEENQYIYSGKSLIIKNKYGTITEYILY